MMAVMPMIAAIIIGIRIFGFIILFLADHIKIIFPFLDIDKYQFRVFVRWELLLKLVKQMILVV